MAYERIGDGYENVTMLYSCFGSDFGRMSLAEAIEWLQGIADEQPCPAGEVVLDIEQSGDQWDGYSEAEIKIFRRETPAERAAREAAYAEEEAESQRSKEAAERHAYEQLKAKYGA